jgi:hypothetical protein
VPLRAQRGEVSGTSEGTGRGGLGLSLRGPVRERVTSPFQLAGVRAQASTRYSPGVAPADYAHLAIELTPAF